MTKSLHFLLAILLCTVSFSTKAENPEITTVLDADFSQFTEGSPTSPVDFPSYGTGSFTQFFPSWYASKVSKAGGAVLIKDGGYLQTSYLNLSANNGTSRITVRVKAIDSYGAAVKISVGYSSANSVTQFIEASGAWIDVVAIVGGGASSSRVKVEPYLSASGILVESIKVEQSPSFIAAPTANQPSNADGTSFTATWSSVSGATGYFIDVYSYNSNNEKVYFIQNEDCGNARSKNITGLDPATTYYFVVRSTNGTAISENSNEIEVVKVISSIDTPIVSDATVANGKATISWQPVDNADSYVVSIYRHSTLITDTETDVLNDDFSKVNEGSLSDIEFTYGYKLDQYTNTSGWDGEELGLAAGYIVLTPFSGSIGSLLSPNLNLSSNNGVFTVSCNLLEAAYGYERDGGTVTFKLLDSDGNELESKQHTITKGAKTYSAEFTNGADGCRVGVYYQGSYKLFIDDFVIRQMKKAGEVIDELIAEEATDATSYSFDYTAEDNVKIGYTVYALGRTVSGEEISEIYSNPSEEKFISGTASIGNIDTDSDLSVRIAVISKGMIEVTTDTPSAFAIYDIKGRLISSGFVADGTSTISCNASGIVIVKVADKSVKVAL